MDNKTTNNKRSGKSYPHSTSKRSCSSDNSKRLPKPVNDTLTNTLSPLANTNLPKQSLGSNNSHNLSISVSEKISGNNHISFNDNNISVNNSHHYPNSIILSESAVSHSDSGLDLSSSNCPSTSSSDVHSAFNGKQIDRVYLNDSSKYGLIKQSDNSYRVVPKYNLKSPQISERLNEVVRLINDQFSQNPSKDCIIKCLNDTIHELNSVSSDITSDLHLVSHSTNSSSDHRSDQHKTSIESINSSKLNNIMRMIKNDVLDSLKQTNSKIRNLELKFSNKFNPQKSEILQTTSVKKRKSTNHSCESNLDRLLIIRKPDNKAISNLYNLLKTNQDLNPGNFKIDYINLHPNRNVYIHCFDTNSRDSIFNLLYEAKYNVDKLVKQFVYVRIGPVPINTNPEILVNSITRCNEFLKGKSDTFNYFTRTRNSKGQVYLVYKVEYNVGEILLQNSFVHFEFNRLNVFNFKPLVQCHKCARFGHTDKYCKYKKLTCPNCNGNHTLKNCQFSATGQLNADNMACANCIRNNLPHNHSSWEVKCPIRTKFIKILINKAQLDNG